VTQTAGQSETIVILDFGSQYAQLIARRVRENGVYSVLARPDVTIDEIKALNPKGLIFTGGPSSVYEPNAPRCRKEVFELGVPILGICYGMQLSCQMLGADVRPHASREYGRTSLKISDADGLLRGMPEETTAWMSHGDQVQQLPTDFIPLAATPSCPFAAVRHKTRPVYGVQFHPEVTHTPHGNAIFMNFLYTICGCAGLWQMGSFIDSVVAQVRSVVKPDERVICGLSGGVDSSVVAALLHKAIGDRLACIFVDNGLLRLDEGDQVMATFAAHLGVKVIRVDAERRFLAALAGVSDPEQKRKIIGRVFIEVFDAEARKLAGVRWLAQGTIYPDVIESAGAASGKAHVIKSHHNVGGLPRT